MRTSPVFKEIYTARIRHPDMVMEDEGSSSNRGEQAAPPEATEAIATSSTSSSSSESGKISAWIGLLALARVAVLHPPLVAMKVKVRVVGVMSK
jgi:hypothetical protein